MPKTDGYYRNQIPDPTRVWTGWCWFTRWLEVQSPWTFYFWKRTPCYEVHCTQARVSTFNRYNNLFQILFIYLFLWCDAGGRGGECDSKMGLKRCIRVLKWDHCRRLAEIGKECMGRTTSDKMGEEVIKHGKGK